MTDPAHPGPLPTPDRGPDSPAEAAAAPSPDAGAVPTPAEPPEPKVGDPGKPKGIRCRFHSERTAVRVCVACRSPICARCAAKLSVDFYCPNCLRSLGKTGPTGTVSAGDLAFASMGGLMGAALGGAAWAWCAQASGTSHPYLGALAGAIAALGVRITTGGKLGGPMTWLASFYGMVAVVIGDRILAARGFFLSPASAAAFGGPTDSALGLAFGQIALVAAVAAAIFLASPRWVRLPWEPRVAPIRLRVPGGPDPASSTGQGPMQETPP